MDPTSGILTLNGLNVQTTEEGICWGEEDIFDYRNLVLQITGDNLIHASKTGIAGRYGKDGNGPSLRIEGNGSLTVTSEASGIWVWKDITIEETPTINITAKANGIANNFDVTSQGGITIKDGELTVKGENRAMGLAPTFYLAKYSVTASKNSDGSGAGTYDETALPTYKYLKFTKAATDPVGIYLRTIGTDQQDISVPTDQRSSLGTPYYYSNWVDYGTFASAKAASFDETQKITYDGEDVKAVIAEMKASTISKKSVVGFSNLDKVVWDTLSWSQNASGPNSWHLNGAIVLCKVKFELNYPDDATGKETEPAMRYAIRGIDINTDFPEAPSCTNYTFDGWYTEADATGSKVTDIPNLDHDVTYYAHWSAETPREYSVTLHANDGILAEGDNITKYTYGTPVTLPIPTKEGYNFGGWYDNSSCTGNPVTAITATTTGNQEFWAKWTEIPATPPTIVTQPQDVTMNYGDADKSFAVTATVEDGYDISYQWYYNTTGGNASGELITDAVNATYNIPNDTVIGTYYYYCEITAKNRTNQKTASIKTQAVTLKVEKKAGNVTPPIAKDNLVYTGDERVLIAAGSSTSGTIEYSLDNQNYSTELPTGTDAKSYTVWYRVLGNETYADVAPQSITVKIDKAAGGTAPTGLTPTAPSKWGRSDGTITGVNSTMEYADNALFENAKDCSDSTITGLAAGTYYVRVKASDNYEASKGATVIVPVGETEVESIEVTSTTHKKQYFVGESLDVNGLVITAAMTDSTTREVPVTAEMISHFDTTAEGHKTITITYAGKTATYGITISKRDFSGIKAADYSGKYDGKAHKIIFTGLPEGATVSYGNSEGSYTESAISYTDFTNGAKTVYYKISMDGYNDMTGSATVTIEKRDVTIKVDAKSKAEGSADPEFTGTVTGLLKDTDLGTITYKRDDADKDKEEVGADISIIAEYTGNSNYDVAVTPAKLTITKKQASSGGGSSSRTDVTTTGTTDSKVTSSPSKVKNETTTDANGNSVTTATVTVSSANQREILKQAKANKSGEIIIKVSQNEVKDGAKLKMNLDKSFIESILNDTDAKLTIQTPSGEKTFTQEELKKLVESTSGNMITIDPAAGTTAPTNPTEPTAPTNPSADKNAKLVKGVERTTIVLKSKLTKDGKVLLTWTKLKGYKVDKFEVYRSVKRHSGYGTKAFFTTKDGSWAKYLNTKNLKAGKTYYYKVRGVRTIGGKKYYTQWSNKAWRTVK